MRDYRFLRYLAKMTSGDYKNKKEGICCVFPYMEDDKTIISVKILFEKSTSWIVYFNLRSVYDRYCSHEEFSTYEEFIDRFLAVNAIYHKVSLDENFRVKYILPRNSREPDMSQALRSITVLMQRLNGFLDRNDTVLNDRVWNAFYCRYISKKKIVSACISGGCFVASVTALGLIAAEVLNDFPLLLAILILVAGLVGGVFFLYRFLFYRRKLKRLIAKDQNSK